MKVKAVDASGWSDDYLRYRISVIEFSIYCLHQSLRKQRGSAYANDRFHLSDMRRLNDLKEQLCILNLVISTR